MKMKFTGYNVEDNKASRQQALDHMMDKYDSLAVIRKMGKLVDAMPDTRKAKRLQEDTSYVERVHREFGGIYEAHKVDGKFIEFHDIDISRPTLKKLGKLGKDNNAHIVRDEISNLSYYSGIGLVVDNEYSGYCYYYSDPRTSDIVNISNYMALQGYRSTLRTFLESYFYRNNYRYAQVEVRKRQPNTQIWLNYWLNSGYVTVTNNSNQGNIYYMVKQLRA